MSKAALLAASAVLALTAGGASAAPEIGAYAARVSPVFHQAKGAQMLYNQNSNSGPAISSQNFTSGSNTAFDDSGADDFVVPKGQTWTVTEVDVTGTYSNGSGPAASENVIFYKNDKKEKTPGKALKGGTFTDLDCSGSPSFSCPLGKGVKLKAGHYWVAVVANCSETSCGQWFWELNNTIHFKQGMWENPNGGFGMCPTWGTVESCTPFAPYGADFMFDLQGKSKQ
ncbi:MAG: hypothetical protein ACREHV_06885 [Rhizomicrobium sp.]